jgi:heme oxygenase
LGLSQTLRDRTGQAHRSAEDAMRLDFDRPDVADYLHLLNGLLVFHTAVAEFSRATVASELGPHTALLSRAQALRADIGLMSVQPTATTDDASSAHRRPAVANPLRGGREERIGAAYVAAGSVLGGRLIAAHLAASGCGDEFPRSFFASDTLDLGRQWRDFKNALDDFGESGADPARVVAGALAAFAFIRDILSRPVPRLAGSGDPSASGSSG